jgi:hypothetical protein
MAIFTNSALIGGIRGRVGNVVFSRNSAGPFIREYVSPVQPFSPGQELYIDTITTLTTEWRNLPDNKKIRWKNFCRDYPFTDALGNIRYYNGYQMFIRQNWWRFVLLATVLDEPLPPREPPLYTFSFTVDSSSNLLQISVANDSPDNTFQFIIYFTDQYFATKTKFFRPDYRVVHNFGGSFNGTASLTTRWRTVFGMATFATGKRIGGWLRILDRETGWMTPGIYNDTLIVA